MKLSYVPDGYPDELLYSIVARYAAHLRSPSHKAVSSLWFGGDDPMIVVDLPSRVEEILRALPTPHAYTSDVLINQHTLYPFYAPFLPATRAHHLRQGMQTSGSGLHWIAGITNCRVPRLRWLRYCPVCVREDRHAYGETYWHRCHQLAGINICLLHEVWLVESQINVHLGGKVKVGSYRAWFLAAEQMLDEVSCAVNPTPVPALIRHLAREAQWLLTHPLTTDSEWLQERYRVLLHTQGWLNPGGSLRRQVVLQRFREQISSDLWPLLGCELTSEDSNWLVNMFRHRQGHAHHPLYHLLLLALLDQSISTLDTIDCSPQAPFGEGPWPCLNPLCPHYQQECIPAYAITWQNKQPVGTFSCTCGYTYVRRGPDATPEARYRVGRVTNYGELWHRHLRQHWHDSLLTLQEVAHRLHTTITTVRRQAAIEHLPFAPEAPWRGKPPAMAFQQERERRREHYRQVWLRVQQDQPEMWLSQLIDTQPAVYAWLTRYDQAWLHEHRPIDAQRELGKKNQHSTRMRELHLRKAQQRDQVLATAIRSAAHRLYTNPGMPLHVTLTAICREMGRAAMFNTARLPAYLTQARQTMTDMTESHEAFMVRKLAWVVKQYQEEQACPSQREFFQRAGVHWRLLKNETIRSQALALYMQHFGERRP